MWTETNMNMITSSVDGTIKVFDGRNGDLLNVLEGHTSTIHDFAIDAVGQIAISAGEDGTCLVFSTGILEQVF
jgi:ribosome assembly protein SQT1